MFYPLEFGSSGLKEVDEFNPGGYRACQFWLAAQNIRSPALNVRLLRNRQGFLAPAFTVGCDSLLSFARGGQGVLGGWEVVFAAPGAPTFYARAL